MSVVFAGEGNGTPLQYSCLENPVDGGAWWAVVHGVAKTQTWLSDFTFTFHFHALEKEMATHSSVLAWRNPGTGEPGGLPSMGSHRVGRNWSDLAAAAATYTHNFNLTILDSYLMLDTFVSFTLFTKLGFFSKPKTSTLKRTKFWSTKHYKNNGLWFWGNSQSHKW